ncbi:MAG: hypothetical protein FWD36_04115 [Treponema sp.]|nr:hypothetical protein [Treponema sp.]
MTITQTVEIPANRRSITLDVPPQIPAGRVILTFTPVVETDVIEFAEASNKEVIAVGDEILDKHLAAFKALAK